MPEKTPPSQGGTEPHAVAELARLRARVAELEREAVAAGERQLELVRVGIALTAERDLDRLLRLILTTARDLVAADAGSLYLIEGSEGASVLRFVLAQNDSVPASIVTTTMPLDTASLAGYVAVTGALVTVADARAVGEDAPYRFNRSFDLATGYHTRSVLAAPIATRAGQVIGVLQLINRKAGKEHRITSEEAADRLVRPFAEAEAGLIRALAAQAAVAIENGRLVREIEELFEGFVRASVLAIEQRDPPTSGHSLRVAHYTTSLARALAQEETGQYRGLTLSRDEMTQLRYAALLHDFGKVGVREAVLTKAKKLHPDRLALIQERLRHTSRTREVALARQLLAALQQLGRGPTAADLESLEAAWREVRAERDAQLAAVFAANEPTPLDEATRRAVDALQRSSFGGGNGREAPPLLPEEARALLVPRGSLDEVERREMESHVVRSYQFLLTIPWPKRFADVPELAYAHHEKLDGRGYPNRLIADQIPVPVRMITIADIYDALTTGDRAYRRASSIEGALDALRDEARSGHLDAELVRVFIAARVFAQPLPFAVPGT